MVEVVLILGGRKLSVLQLYCICYDLVLCELVFRSLFHYY